MRRKRRSAFSQYLASEVIDGLVNGPKPYRAAPEPTELCFILLQVRDDPVDQAPRISPTRSTLSSGAKAW
jgi:hypothetical protein